MLPKIYAKSCMELNNINIKLNIGCDGIEIQLLDELIKGTPVNKLLDHNLIGLPIKVIHSPLISGIFDSRIEFLAIEEHCSLITDTFKIADFFASNNNKIFVLAHTDLYYTDWKNFNEPRTSIISKLDFLLNKYANVDVLIENVVSPVVTESGLIEFKATGFDVPKIVKDIRETLGTTRISTCLDTCHALMSEDFLNKVANYIGEDEHKQPSLDDFFEVNADCCELIHLANVHNSGYRKGDHGTTFENCELVLRRIINLYKHYDYNCPITLEVFENDYLKSDNYKFQKEQLERMWDK